MNILQLIITYLYNIVGLGVGIEYEEYTGDSTTRQLKFTKEQKVISFSIINVGENSLAYVGKGAIFEKIPSGYPLPFGLDSFFYFCDCLTFKFVADDCTTIEDCDETTPDTKHHIIVKKYVVKKH